MWVDTHHDLTGSLYLTQDETAVGRRVRSTVPRVGRGTRRCFHGSVPRERRLGRLRDDVASVISHPYQTGHHRYQDGDAVREVDFRGW